MADEKALGLSVLSTIRDWVKSLIPGTATASTKGIVQPDGTTITINNGVISAAGGGGSSEGSLTFYGTCATAAATQAKAVVCEEFTSSHLVEGTVLHVKFTYAQTYNGAPTLNVNSTGAKNIRRVGTTNAARYEWVAGEMLTFVYDGTAWVLTDAGFATTTYYGVTRLSSATNSTSTALAATASAVKAAYDLADGKQDELVSGTNIKTVNGNSLLGSGDIDVSELPTVTASDNDKVLTVVSGAWAAATPSGGGSGVSYTKTTVTIGASDWSNNTCTKNVTGVTASNDVLVTYAPASKAAYIAADVYCSAQGAGTLTFRCTTTPTSAIKVNVMIFDGGVTPPISVISFTVHHLGSDDVVYNAESGMTWTEWCDSSYNTGGYSILDGMVINSSGMFYIENQSPSDVIIDGTTYILTGGGNN